MKEAEPFVFVVDDDPSMRKALANLFESIELRVKCFASAKEFLRFRRPEVPVCLVLDVRMAGLSGLDLQRELVARGEPIPIVFVTGYGDIPMAVNAMKAGAVEFLSKPFREQELLDAVRRALDFDREMKLQRETMAGLHERYDKLSMREREVMRHLVKGRLNKQIAADMGISEVTVKVHRRHIMEKMNARTFAELVLMAERLHETA